MNERIILHVDMDAFYASVETRDRPELDNVPVVIGADPKNGNGRGVVSTANYAARAFGIGSAMPISQAYAACPEAVFLRPSFAKYKEASDRVMEVLAEYADVREIVGMDEAYLDVTQAVGGDWNRVPAFCRSLQGAIHRATQLRCSVGAASTKSIAKIASDYRKPHGVTVVQPPELQRFLARLPVRLINGCGPKSATRLQEVGIETIGELAATPCETLEAWLGKSGRWLWHVAHGQDQRAVHASRGPSKSRGNERTYPADETNHTAILEHASLLLEGLMDRHEGRGFATLTIKVRYRGFHTVTRSHSTPSPLDPETPTARDTAQEIVRDLMAGTLDERPVRLIGVRLSNFAEHRGQQPLDAFGLRARTRYSRAGRPPRKRPETNHRITVLTPHAHP